MVYRINSESAAMFWGITTYFDSTFIKPGRTRLCNSGIEKAYVKEIWCGLGNVFCEYLDWILL